jgi:hypothetical protein
VSPSRTYRGPKLCPVAGLEPPLNRLLPRVCRPCPSPKSAESGGRVRSLNGIDCGGVEGLAGSWELFEVGGIMIYATSGDPEAYIL